MFGRVVSFLAACSLAISVDGTRLRTAVQNALGESSGSGTTYQCSSLTVNNAGSYEVNHLQLWFSSSCEFNFGYNLLVDKGVTQNLLNIENPSNGCFATGQSFNLWVNNDAATKAFMDGYTFVGNPDGTWCEVTLTGTVDAVGFTFNSGLTYPVVSANRFCIENGGGFAVNSYQLWQNPNCQYQIGGGNNVCISLPLINSTTGCFQNGANMWLWVNAAAATQSYMVPYTINYQLVGGFNNQSQWIEVKLSGGVDDISTTIAQQNQLPYVYTSSIAACNHGFYMVNSINMYYGVVCESKYGANQGEINLAALAQDETSCFSPGTVFNFKINPTAATHSSVAPYNFVYDPAAFPVVLFSGGAVDTVSWGYVSPVVAVVNTTDGSNYICEPDAYAVSAMNSSNWDTYIDAITCPKDLHINNSFALCSQTRAISCLTSLDENPVQAQCNADPIATMIENLMGSLGTLVGVDEGSDEGEDEDEDEDGTSDDSGGFELQPITASSS